MISNSWQVTSWQVPINMQPMASWGTDRHSGGLWTGAATIASGPAWDRLRLEMEYIHNIYIIYIINIQIFIRFPTKCQCWSSKNFKYSTRTMAFVVQGRDWRKLGCQAKVLYADAAPLRIRGRWCWDPWPIAMSWLSGCRWKPMSWLSGCRWKPVWTSRKWTSPNHLVLSLRHNLVTFHIFRSSNLSDFLTGNSSKLQHHRRIH